MKRNKSKGILFLLCQNFAVFDSKFDHQMTRFRPTIPPDRPRQSSSVGQSSHYYHHHHPHPKSISKMGPRRVQKWKRHKLQFMRNLKILRSGFFVCVPTMHKAALFAACCRCHLLMISCSGGFWLLGVILYLLWNSIFVPER